jgi:hypothetical protein
MLSMIVHRAGLSRHAGGGRPAGLRWGAGRLIDFVKAAVRVLLLRRPSYRLEMEERLPADRAGMLECPAVNPQRVIILEHPHRLQFHGRR